jgi:hypothetical protein
MLNYGSNVYSRPSSPPPGYPGSYGYLRAASPPPYQVKQHVRRSCIVYTQLIFQRFTSRPRECADCCSAKLRRRWIFTFKLAPAWLSIKLELRRK